MKNCNKKYLKWGTKALCLLLLVCMCFPVLSMPAFSATAEAADTTEQNSDMVKIVVAKSDVAAGKKLSTANITLKEVHKSRVPDNALYEIGKVTGKYLTAPLYKDEYLRSDQIADEIGTKKSGKFVNVGDFVEPNTGRDVTTKLQQVIDDNPAKTIYFPDGEYLISKSLRTYGGAAKAVSLWLSDGAVIKAHQNWKTEEGTYLGYPGSTCDYSALICFGANDGILTDSPANDVSAIGSYYSIQGGTLDGNGLANGISLDGGRETLVKNMLIKNTKVGIRVNIGINNKSSDMDIDDVVIDCSGIANSIGIDIYGYDNTFSNIRIYNAQTGIRFPQYAYPGTSNKHNSGGNAFHNVHMYQTFAEDSKLNYGTTIGVHEGWHGNFYYECYVENYATAYYLNANCETFDTCTARWTSDKVTKQVAIMLLGDQRMCFMNFRAEFFGSGPSSTMLNVNGRTFSGKFELPIYNPGVCDNDLSNSYIRNGKYISLG